MRLQSSRRMTRVYVLWNRGHRREGRRPLFLARPWRSLKKGGAK